jgi:hypothetical protein
VTVGSGTEFVRRTVPLLLTGDFPLRHPLNFSTVHTQQPGPLRPVCLSNFDVLNLSLTFSNIDASVENDVERTDVWRIEVSVGELMYEMSI